MVPIPTLLYARACSFTACLIPELDYPIYYTGIICNNTIYGTQPTLPPSVATSNSIELNIQVPNQISTRLITIKFVGRT